jgi:hypothetical protein
MIVSLSNEHFSNMFEQIKKVFAVAEQLPEQNGLSSLRAYPVVR